MKSIPKRSTQKARKHSGSLSLRRTEVLDTFHAALSDASKSAPLAVPAFGSMADFTERRDGLPSSIGTYK
jgi:hypothetical protein